MYVQIFVNGPFEQSTSGTVQPAAPDMVLAIDGGASHCQKLGIRPDTILGDLDSIASHLLTQYREERIEILQFPARKNATDLELGLDLAMERGATEVDIYYSLGGRWDMSIANLLLAASPKYRKMQLNLISFETQISILHASGQYCIKGLPGQTFSLLPLGGDVNGVYLSGCEYPLTDTNVPFGSSLGVSNVFASSKVEVQFRQGILAFIKLSSQL